jgi:hypothetical protein
LAPDSLSVYLAVGVYRPGDKFDDIPFKNYKTFCPYLIGSYDEVRREVSKYIRGEFKLLSLMCRQIVKSYITHPLYLMAVTRMLSW